MMLRRVLPLLAAAALLAGAAAPEAFSSPGPSPSGTVTKGSTGSAAKGTRVWWWVPQREDGKRPPVVVVVHGFSALDPALYGATIAHLWREGYAVIYPQFQRADAGFITESDQNVFLRRAVETTNHALDILGDSVDRSDLVVYGHSLGGLIASVWNPAGGSRARAAVLANPSTATEVPANVPVEITPIPVETLAPQVDIPVFILTGNDDRIAPPSQSTDLWALLTGAPVREVWMARTDYRGLPPVRADHVAPLNFANGIAYGVLDKRYYQGALDQAISGATTLTFYLGSRPLTGPIRPPVRLR